MAGVVSLLFTMGCGVLTGGGGTPRSIGGFNEDRVGVGNYGTVLGVATSPRMVFVASETGIAVRDVLSDRWLRPLTEADGYPAGRITGIAGDPEQDAVWITALGEVLYYRPAIDQLVRTMIAGRIERIFFDRSDPGAGAYVGYGDQWSRVSAMGFASPVMYDQLPPAGQRVFPASLETLRDEMPALQSFAGLLTRDDALRSWPLTSGARISGRSEVWLGTAGGGAYLADPLFNRARSVPYGLFERGASSLALASDGVWVGSLGMDIRGTGGVVAASADLQEWAWLRGPADGSMAGLRVHDMIVRDGMVWVATDRGVAVRTISAAAGARPPEWEWALDRETGRAFALAFAPSGMWVGTDRGVALMQPSDAGARTMPGGGGGLAGLGTAPVRALLATGDTLWIGTEIGLRRARTVNGVHGLFDFTNRLPAWLERPIVALARSDSILVVATTERVAVIDPRRDVLSGLPGDPDIGRLGRLLSVAADGRTVWVGGDRGAVVIDRATGLVRNISQPGVLADAVLDIALQPEFAWLATPGGLVRIRRLPDGGAR
jgi:ligand-binding sensor domain-containing protein